MALPVVALPKATVDVDGTPVEVRSLSRSEALKLNTQFSTETVDDAEIFVIVCGTGVSEEEAREWREQTDPTTAGLVIDKIIELSGITPDGSDPKSGTKGRS